MANIREAELPGLGKKFQMLLDNGEQIVVIVHDDGIREVYYFNEDSDDPVASFSLSDKDARQLGSIIGGAFYQPQNLERLETAMSDFRIEWLKVKDKSNITGKSIGDLSLRKNHRIIIIAALEDKGKGRKEAVCINPGPNYIFQPGHTVIAAGRGDKMREFEKMFGDNDN